MLGKDLIMSTLLGGGSSGGGGIPQADIDAAFAALAEKGVTVPDGATSADLDELIASIVTGGGDVTVQAGSVTFAENTKAYTFVEGSPDLFVLYATPTTNIEHSEAKYEWAHVQKKSEQMTWTYGYNTGMYKYYTPLLTPYKVANNYGKWPNGFFGGDLGATTYNWIAIWGV